VIQPNGDEYRQLSQFTSDIAEIRSGIWFEKKFSAVFSDFAPPSKISFVANRGSVPLL